MLRAIPALFAVIACAVTLITLLQTFNSNRHFGVNALPQGFTTFFDAEKCPTGWEELVSSQGRMIVSVSDANNAGITVGVPLADREDRTHTHRTKLAGTLPSKHIAGADGANTHGAQNGPVQTQVTSEEATSGLPFTQLILCRITPQVANAEPTAFGTIGFYSPDVNACPNINSTSSSSAALKNNKQRHLQQKLSNGTSWVPMSSLNGRLAVGGFVEGGAVNNNQPSYASGEDRQHNHTNNKVLVQEVDVSYAGIDGCCNNRPSEFQKDLTIVGDSDSASSNLPYLQLLTCGSTDYTFDLKMPPNALVFNQEKCPPGWELALELAGRVLVSLPRNGQPGGFFGGQSFSPAHPVDPQHMHGLNGTINFPAGGIELDNACCSSGYAGSGSFPFAGKTTDSDVDVPFTMYPLCRQSSDLKIASHRQRSVVGKHYQDFKEKMMVEKMMKKN